jgi:hypothetical protein
MGKFGLQAPIAPFAFADLLFGLLAFSQIEDEGNALIPRAVERRCADLGLPPIRFQQQAARQESV